MHTIVGSNTPAVARLTVRVVFLLGELYGHGPWLAATIEVRSIPASQRALFAA